MPSATIEGFISLFRGFVWVGNLSLPNLFNYLYQYGPVDIHLICVPILVT